MPSLLRVLLAGAIALVLAAPAHAYPWMIQHAYTGCAQCHVDPSGGSAMTAYGRAQSEILLRSHYGETAGTEPGKVKDFLFGVLNLPPEVLAQIDARHLVIPRPGQVQYYLMQADLRGGVQTKKFVVYGSLGVVSAGAEAARITSNEGGFNLVSREYWAGFVPGKGMLLRAGRIPLPFGIRTEEHILFTRAATRTTVNDDQQVGLAFSYGSRKIRAEVMGIAGNFQVSPDAYRERGYAGYLAWAPFNELELGVSSQVRRSALDVDTYAPGLRHAHGVFGRWSPVDKVALMAEADLMAHHHEGAADLGVVGELEGDWEPWQGLHVKAGGELCEPVFSDASAPMGRGWAAAQWFFYSKLDLRVDALYGARSCTPDAEVGVAALAQLHFFL